MSCRGATNPKACDGRSSFDIVIPAPTLTELLLVEQLFAAREIEGETYMGPIFPVYLISWKEETD